MTPTPRTLFVVAVVLASTVTARAQVFPVLQGDPVDGLGRALPILPGVPLITANGDGDFNPPVIDPNTIGDVDLVVRAGHVTPGATMPPPALVPPSAAAGGSRLPGGSDIPFTVIASDGDPTVAGGHPLLGPELDGIPVVVFAFADLDRDGVVGPTNADPDGAADNARELQESEFPVGMRVAYFTGGVAQGVIASDVGAPESAGGLPVVLTAAAYVGQFSLDFFLGTVPDGPAITTLQPFFPRLDPDRVIDTDGSAGPALPDGRIAVEFESEFAPPVNDPVLGTPFALPTDGSSVTIDRALVGGGSASRARFVRPSAFAGLTGNEPRLPLRPGAGQELFEPLTDASVVDDGPGNGVAVRLVPVDVLGNVTDPASPLTAELTARFGAVIASPDLDGDPAHESVSLGGGAGILVTVDDSGAVSDSIPHGTVTVAVDGFGVDQLFVHVTPGPPPPPPDVAPTVGLADVIGPPAGFSLACPAAKTLSVDAWDGTSEVVAVAVALSQDEVVLQEVDLTRSTGGSSGRSTWTTTLPPPPGTSEGTLTLTAVARDANGLTSQPSVSYVAAADALAPVLAEVHFTPPTLTKFARMQLVIEARFADDCGGIRNVSAKLTRAKGYKRFVRLNDRGRKSDATANDGMFTGKKRLRVPQAASLEFLIEAKNKHGVAGSTRVTVPVVP